MRVHAHACIHTRNTHTHAHTHAHTCTRTSPTRVWHIVGGARMFVGVRMWHLLSLMPRFGVVTARLAVGFSIKHSFGAILRRRQRRTCGYTVARVAAAAAAAPAAADASVETWRCAASSETCESVSPLCLLYWHYLYIYISNPTYDSKQRFF